MLIVTGATGVLGREIVEQLLRRVPAERLAVSVRDPGAASDLADRGVRVRRGDYTDPESLASAFAGAEQILLVSSNTRAGDTLEQHRNAIDAAVAAGTGRILYTSHAGARADSPFLPTRNHAATEEMLAACGVPYTALRNGFYAATPAYYTAPALETGTIAVPADGPVAWTTQADLAEGAAAVLAGEDRFDGPTPPLTAGRTWTFDELAAALSELTGRTITRTVLADEDFVAATVAGGAPEPAARFSLAIFEAARRGDFAAVDPTLERLLGRPPATMPEVLIPDPV